jgi:hypothetical protein
MAGRQRSRLDSLDVSSVTGFLLALLVLALIVSALATRVPVPGRAGVLLRTLFPSFRFFESEEPSLCLLARTRSEGRELSPFAPVLSAARRRPLSLVFNPEGNLALACYALLETLVAELAELGPTAIGEAEQLVSYRLVQNLAVASLRRRGLQADGVHYELKLLSVAADTGDAEELFVSPPYPLG